MQTEAGAAPGRQRVRAGPRRRRRGLRRDPLRPRAAPRARAWPSSRWSRRSTPASATASGWRRRPVTASGSRHCSPRCGTPPRAREIAELAVHYRDEGVAGFDIAGAEAGFPPTRHLDAFEYLRRENAHFTIHAGEAFGLPSIWEAIQWCGADRLGHGVRIVDDITVDGAPFAHDVATAAGADAADVELGLLAAYVRDRRDPAGDVPEQQHPDRCRGVRGAAPDLAAQAAAVPGHGQHRQPADERHVDVPRDGPAGRARPAGRSTTCAGRPSTR